ncbi:hypothetical protein CLUG_00115, partial [Clavispora lusitaniae ATCC 42720]
QVMGFRVGSSLGLVTDDVITVWDVFVQWVLEESRDEWGAEVHSKYLVVGSRVLSQGLDGFRRSSQVKTTNVKVTGVFNQSPVFWLLQVRRSKQVSGSQIGHQSSVLSSDQCSTFAGCGGFLNSVFSSQSILGVGLLQLLGVDIVTSGAKVNDRVRWQNVLSASSSVLSSTSGNQLQAIHFKHFIVDGHVFLFGQNGLIVIQRVFFQVRSVDVDLQIQQRVS